MRSSGRPTRAAAEAVFTLTAAACGFLRFLKDSFGARRPGGDLIRSVIKYEYSRLFILSMAPHAPRSDGSTPRADSADSYPRIQRLFLLEGFDYDLTKAIPALRLTKCLPPLEPDPTLILFYRNWRTGDASTAKVSPMTSDLVSLCDGRTAASSILRRLGKRASDDGGVTLKALKLILARLEEEGVLRSEARLAVETEGGAHELFRS